MPKGVEQSKSTKKKPQHTLKEKRQMKKEKKSHKDTSVPC
jgi:hypothetical protein